MNVSGRKDLFQINIDSLQLTLQHYKILRVLAIM